MRAYKYSEEIHGRIAQVRATLKLSQSAMARQLGYSKGYFGKVESNRQYVITEHVVISICNAYGVSYDYLAFGEGPMFRDEASIRALYDIFRRLSQEDQRCVIQFAEFLHQKDQK